MFKIEANVPMPSVRVVESEVHNTILAMKIGDSVLLETPARATTFRSGLASLQKQKKIALDIVFAGRKVEGGHRIWMLKKEGAK